MHDKITIRFPTLALHPREESGTKELKYFDIRRAIAHAINTYNWADIWRLDLTDKDQSLLKNIPTTTANLLLEQLPEGWDEALVAPDFNDKLVIYVYTYWWDATVTTTVDPRKDYLYLFQEPLNPQLKRRYKQIKNYVLSQPAQDPDQRAKQLAWSDYCEYLLQNGIDGRELTEEDNEFYTLVLNYWDGEVKKKAEPQQPLQTPYGTLSPKAVRRKYRDIRDDQVEWFNDYITSHPEVDISTYDGRCQIILAWYDVKANIEVKKLRKKLGIKEGQ